MIGEITEFYGVVREFKKAEYLQTDKFQSTYKDVKTLIKLGNLIVLSGIVGVGKTSVYEEILRLLRDEKDILVAESLTLERSKVNMATLTNALFADLANEKIGKIPSQSELRERKLRDLICKKKKNVALFIDDAHGLNNKTLIGLKNLLEVIQRGGGNFSVILIGHPKLQNNLSLPSMEEIGGRAVFISLDVMDGRQREYMNWILESCFDREPSMDPLFSDEALDFLASKLSTPLQINQHLWKALTQGYKTGQRQIGKDLIEEILSPDLDGLATKLIRHGYNTKILAETIHTRPSEIKSFLQGKLPSGRMSEIADELRRYGVPLG